MSEDHKNGRLTFNVGGQRHEAYLSTLKAIPGTRLSWIADNYLLLQHSSAYDLGKDEFFFDRSPTCFVSILNYYRTGELHYPTNVCGPSFATELRFWGLDEAQMQSCCWEGYTENRDKDAKLKGFKGPHFESAEAKKNEEEESCERFGKHYLIINQLWKFFDDAYSSRGAKIYSFVGHALLFFYILLPIIGTISSIKHSKNNNAIRARECINITEIILNIFFSMEFIVRFTLCPNKKRFVKSFLNIADLMSVIPVYINLVFTQYGEYESIKNYINILVVFRIVKVFRSFRYNYTLQVLANTLKESLPELSLLVFLMLLLATVFAYACYFTEQHDPNTDFVSVPRSLWWAFITMTTVGYGDMYPHSWIGQILGIMAAICGLLMVALPVSVVATNFAIYYSYAKARISLPPKKKVKVAREANNFLGEGTPRMDQDQRVKILNNNRITPIILSAPNGTPLLTRRSRLNILEPIDEVKYDKLHRAIARMKQKGLIQTSKRKMDLASLVAVLSSKGDWESPS